MNFSNVQPRATKNTRTGGSGGRKGVNFSGWKVATNQKGTLFALSDNLYESLGMANKAFAQLPPQDGKVYLFLYSDDQASNATIYKQTGKGENKTRKFKADVLRDDLISVGILTVPGPDDVIEANKPHVQYIGMEEVEGAEGLPEGVEAVYVITGDANVEEVGAPQASVASEPTPSNDEGTSEEQEEPAAEEEQF